MTRVKIFNLLFIIYDLLLGLRFFTNRLCRNYIAEQLFSLLYQQNYKSCSLIAIIKLYSQTPVKISAISLWYCDYYAVCQLPSLEIKPVTPTILIILAILKQLDKMEASALTPSKPRSKKPVTFKLCFKWPNGSSAFCLRSL